MCCLSFQDLFIFVFILWSGLLYICTVCTYIHMFLNHTRLIYFYPTQKKLTLKLEIFCSLQLCWCSRQWGIFTDNVYFGLINRGHEAAALVVQNQIPYALLNSGLDGTRILRDLMKKDGKQVAFINNFQKYIIKYLLAWERSSPVPWARSFSIQNRLCDTILRIKQVVYNSNIN